MKKYTIQFAIIVIILTSVLSFGQTIPQTINYQGLLKNASEIAVANGDYDLTFKLYDVETDGSALWTETKTITVADGIVNTQLGSVTPIDLPFDKEYWLGIKVGTESELTPRIKLSTVPYSYMSMNVADGSITAEKIKSGEVVKSINSLTDDVNLVAGANVTIVPSGNNLTISSSGTGGSLTLPYSASVNSPGSVLFYLTNSASSGTNCGVWGKINSTAGYGVQGLAASTSGSNYGVYGRSYSSEGTGVYGWASSTTGSSYGVYAENNSTTGFGIYSKNSATTGINYSIFAENNSTSGRGIGARAYSTTGTTYGMYGASNSTSGCGVYGTADATTGSTYGVYGRSISEDGYGVYGTGPKWGLVGKATSTSIATTGVYGVSDSPTGTGLYGISPNYGVVGYTQGTTLSNFGVYGISVNNNAWAGRFDGNGDAVNGRALYVTGYSNFEGYMSVGGNFICWGSKSAAVQINNLTDNEVSSSDDWRLVYCVESPEVWFEDFGYGKLNNGSVTIQLDEIFAKTINTNSPYHVFITPYGDSKQLYVTNRTANSFTVVESGGGSSSIEFSYKIVAKRLHYENKRLEKILSPDNPNNLSKSRTSFLEQMNKPLEEPNDSQIGNDLK